MPDLSLCCRLSVVPNLWIIYSSLYFPLLRVVTAEASLATSLMIIGAWAGCLVGGPTSEVSGKLCLMLIWTWIWVVSDMSSPACVVYFL